MNPETEYDFLSSESDDDEVLPMSKSLGLQSEDMIVTKGKTLLEKEQAFQIKKRTLILEELRKAYLRDVVAVKHIINEVLIDEERRKVFDNWKDTVPSASLKEQLLLRSPYLGAFTIPPCKKCGGTVEIVFSDIQKVKDLQAKNESLISRNELLRLMIGTQEAKIETLTIEAASELKTHAEEKKFLYSELRKYKNEIDEAAVKARYILDANKKMREENLKYISTNNDMTIRALENEKMLERAFESNAEYKKTIGELHQEIYGFQTGAIDLKTKIDSLEESLKKKDTVINRKIQIIQELNVDISELKLQLDKLREFSKAAENAADLADRAKQSLVEENRKLESVIENHIRANESLGDKVETMREEMTELIDNLDASRKVVIILTHERDMERAMVAGLTAQLEQKTTEMDECTKKLVEEQKVSLEKSEKIEGLTLEVERLDSERSLDSGGPEAGLQLGGVFDEVSFFKDFHIDSHLSENEHSSTDHSLVLQDTTQDHADDSQNSPKVRSYNHHGDKKKHTKIDRSTLPDNASSTEKIVLPDALPDTCEDSQPPQRASTAPTVSKRKYAPVVKKVTTKAKLETSKATEFVALFSPINPDSIEEIGMRDRMMTILLDKLDEVTARKVLNVLTPYIADSSKILETTLQVASDAVVIQRRAQQVAENVKVFIGGALKVMSCDNVQASTQIQKVLSDVVQAFGSDVARQKRSSIISNPQKDVNNGSSIESSHSVTLDNTVPCINLVSYREVFGAYNSVTNDNMQDLQDIVKSIQSDVESTSQFFVDGVSSVAEEWATSKTVALSVDHMIDEAKKSVMQDLGPTISEHEKNLKRLTAKLETEIAGRKLLVQKYNESTTEISRLKPRSDRLSDAEDRARFLQKEHDEMEISLRDMKLKYSQLESRHSDQEGVLAGVRAELEDRNIRLEKHRRNGNAMRGSLNEQTKEILDLNNKVTELEKRDYDRVHCLVNAETQYCPVVNDACIQTEFIIPAMSLAVDKQRDKYKRAATEGYVVTPTSLFNESTVAAFRNDLQSMVFEKELESYRLGKNKDLPNKSVRAQTMSDFAVSLLERPATLNSLSRRKLSRSLPSLETPIPKRR